MQDQEIGHLLHQTNGKSLNNKLLFSNTWLQEHLFHQILSSLSKEAWTVLYLQESFHILQLGGDVLEMGFGRKVDPEPGRCRRTNGKKWRCSKEAYPDSKQCERHIHKGRNCSGKVVELVVSSSSAATTTP